MVCLLALCTRRAVVQCSPVLVVLFVMLHAGVMVLIGTVLAIAERTLRRVLCSTSSWPQQ